MLKNLCSKITKKMMIITLAVVALGAGLCWYLLMPRGYELNTQNIQPVRIISVREPSVSRIGSEKIFPDTVYVQFDGAVVKPEFIGRDINEHMSVHPPVRGNWRFSGDMYLYFYPENDWIPNMDYRVTISREIINENADLSDRSFTFRSPTFRGSVSESKFYEDPKNVKSKHAIATFKFTYPVNLDDLEGKIKVYSNSGERYKFTYNLTDLNRTLHVMSDPVKIKKDADFVNIEVSNLANAYNATKISSSVKAVISIPSISDFFKLNSVTTEIIRNEQKDNNPEQILFVNFSTSVKAKDLKNSLNVYVYNDYCSRLRERVAKAENDISAISGLSLVELFSTSNEEASKTHAFRYHEAGMNNCLLVKVAKGLSSVEDFDLAVQQVIILEPARYPREAKIAFEGSLIPLKGEKTLSFVSRGVNRLDVKIARINTVDLNHLMTQTAGNFSHPYFRGYTFDETNIAEIFQKKLEINMTNPAEENYSSLDLTPYFKEKRGIFLVRLSGTLNDNYRTYEDSRLIVITDLGLIVKEHVDNTHSLFVASITNGSPVSGAKVEVLGKNGIPVISTSTNDKGFAAIADFRDFRDEKFPVVYKISLGTDISYMPINRHDRRLNLSRFDVGGIYDGDDSSEVTAYAFTDRGIIVRLRRPILVLLFVTRI